MKKLLLSTLFLFAVLPLAMAGNITWQPGTQLTWADFQGPIDPSSPFTATTHYVVRYNYKWDAQGGITVNIDCYFDPQQSWKKTTGLTDKLLRHEQLHFNIAELYARKMRQAFAAYIASHQHSTTTRAELQAIFDNTMTECHRYEARYDDETDHSKKEDKQREWDTQIMSQLRELNAYIKQ